MTEAGYPNSTVSPRYALGTEPMRRHSAKLELSGREDLNLRPFGPISALAADGGVVVPIELLFKKPFRLARRLEMMVGLGPELLIYRSTSNDGQFFGIEVALDFMWWPSRHVGLWIEPAYDLVFRNGVEHGLGSTGGVIFGW